jgi:hypothetical protein
MHRTTVRLSMLAAISAGLLALSPALASATTTASPGAVAFPETTAVGSTSPLQGVVVNVSCTIVINNVVPQCAQPGVFQPNPSTTGDFAIDTNGCGTSPIVGNNPFAPVPCVVTVAFKPKAGGPRTGTLTLGDDQTAPGTPGTVSLTGTGVATPGSGSTTGKKCKKKKHKSSAQIAKKKCKKKK